MAVDGQGFVERMDTCICTLESLLCSQHCLLIGYTPIQNEKSKVLGKKRSICWLYFKKQKAMMVVIRWKFDAGGKVDAGKWPDEQTAILVHWFKKTVSITQTSW